MSGQEDQFVTVGKYKVKIIRKMCIGDSTCTSLSPQVFQLDKNFKAFVQEGSTETIDNLLMTAQSCPVSAIVVVDAETGEQVWPK